ncbi:MAG: DHA2 family efflux MFS transporter permease subunit [Oscillospiraceae bacterium]|nr:DHA2 family efflux MFS transporter permease subunit [Oscillospiraceae bacterium]
MTKSQKSTIAVLVLGAFLSVLNQTLITPAIPSIMEEFSIGATTVQWLVSGFMLVNTIVLAMSAFFMDKFKTKSLFIASFVIFIIGNLLSAWGANFSMVLAGRLLQAVCAGIMMPISMTTLLLIFPHEKRGAAMGMYSFVVMFAPSIGPVIAGVLTDRVGWHVMFLIMAALAVAVIAIAVFVMKDFSENKNVTLDKQSVLYCAAGLFSLLYGFSMIGHAETMLIGAIMIAAGAVIIAVFARRQLKLKNPFLKIGIMRDKQFKTGAVVLMLVAASLVAGGITMPLYVQSVRGMSATVSGMIMMPGAICGAIFGYFAGTLSDRFGIRPIVMIGATTLIVGSVSMAFWDFNTPVSVLTVIYCVRYIGLMLTNTPVSLWAIDKLSNDVLNHGNALSNTMRQVASTLGTAIMVSVMSLVTNITVSDDPLKAQLTGIQATFYLSAAIAIVSFIIILVYVRNKNEDYRFEAKIDTAIAEPVPVLAPDAPGNEMDIHIEGTPEGQTDTPEITE